MTKIKQEYNYRNSKDNKNAVKSTDGKGHVYNYQPANKEEREIRRIIWEDYTAAKNDPLRKEAEERWDLGMKMYRMWAPKRAAGDWRADIILPDGFSAVQSHMQEVVNLRPRPELEGVEASDADLERFCNSIFNFAMDKTEFDEETHKARHCSTITGDANTIEEYRYETRKVKYPKSVKDGEIVYEEKEIVDYDDVYTRFIENDEAFHDPAAQDPKYRRYCLRREVLPLDAFKASYEGKDGFVNVDQVCGAGAVPDNVQFFKKAEDMDDQDVEVLHYWNVLTDTYGVLANNVVIRDTPMPSRHKQLPIDKWTFYPIPGQIYGMGIPFIMHSLVEERRSSRNLNLDRNKLNVAGMFITNDLFDIDENDLTPRLHGLVKVNTNGLPLRDAIMPLQYGDVPMSSIRMDETLKEDERRAHGMDDRPALQAGGTATEAAIVKESAQQRINLISTQQAWQTLIRLGQKKWSNIQLFYGAARMEEIVENNKTKEKPVYRTIKIQNMDYKISGDEKTGQSPKLEGTFVPGKSYLNLNPAFFGYVEKANLDIIMKAGANSVVSKPIKQARVTEMFNTLANNPMLARFLDPQKAVKRYVQVNDESPEDWLPEGGMDREQMRWLAQQENIMFMDMERTGKIYMVPGTPGATTDHTEVHLDFTNTAAFNALSEPVKDAIRNHIAEEHENNPQTASMAESMGASGGGAPAPEGGPEQGGGGNAVLDGQPGGPAIDPAAGMAAPVVGGDVTNGLPVA